MASRIVFENSAVLTLLRALVHIVGTVTAAISSRCAGLFFFL